MTAHRRSTPCRGECFSCSASSAEEGEQVAPAHVEHRTRGNDGAETHLLGETPVENRRQQRAALAEKRDVAWPRDILGKRGIQSNQGIHHPQTIRSDQSSRAAFQFRLDLFFERNSLRAFFLESRRNHDD